MRTIDFPESGEGETPTHVVVTAAIDPSPTNSVTRRLPIASLTTNIVDVPNVIRIDSNGLKLYCIDDATWYFLTITLDQGVPTLTLTPDP